MATDAAGFKRGSMKCYARMDLPKATRQRVALKRVDNYGSFIVTGQECDRVADVHAAGTMTFYLTIGWRSGPRQ